MGAGGISGRNKRDLAKMNHFSKAILFGLFLFSGASGLVYELVWTRELIFVFGGTTYAITTVLVAFMSGLGLGSFLCSRIAPRLSQPGRVYGLLEIGIGLYALAVPFLLQAVYPLYRSAYSQVVDQPWLLTAARFLLGSLVLLVPTTLMGATLPILVRHISLLGTSFGRSVSYLYGINTLGAVLGTVGAGFLFIPALGLTHTTRLAAAINIAIGLTALVALKISGAASATSKDSHVTPKDASESASPAIEALSSIEPYAPFTRSLILITFGVSGFSAMVYQISWTRALVLSIGSSTYSFTSILAAFILGLALGSLIVSHWIDRWERKLWIFGAIELAIGLAAAVLLPLYGRIPMAIFALVANYSSDYPLMIFLQFLLVFAITLVPTILMGATFPLATHMIASRDESPASATGRAYAANTIGTIIGSFLAGFFLIRGGVLGTQGSIILASFLNGAAGAVIMIHARSPQKSFVRSCCGPAAILMAIPWLALRSGTWDLEVLVSQPYYGSRIEKDPLTFKKTAEVIYFNEGVDLTVAVTQNLENPEGISLSVNGKFDASTGQADMPTQLLTGHLPALLGKNDREACLIGLGSGISLAALSRHPHFERIDCAEISDEVIEAAQRYFSPYAYDVFEADARVRILHADGRNHLLLSDKSYDLIVSEPSNPWIAGVSSLFTAEFFELCSLRLNPGGRCAVWLQSYMMSLEDFRMVAKTISHVFTHVSLWQMTNSDYLFVASDEPLSLPLEVIRQRYRQPGVQADLMRIGFTNVSHVLGRFVAADQAVRDWAAVAPLHTDDNALLEFSAPQSIHGHEELSIAHHLYLLQSSPFGSGLVEPEPSNWEHQEIVARTQRVAQANFNYIQSARLAVEQEFEEALHTLLLANQADPENLPVYNSLHEARNAIMKDNPKAMANPKIRDLLDRVPALRQPIQAPLRGATVPEIIENLISVAKKSADQNQRAWAAGYWANTHDFDPQNGELLIECAAALYQAQQPAEAMAKLNAGLKSQILKPGELLQHEKLAEIRKDPCWNELQIKN